MCLVEQCLCLVSTAEERLSCVSQSSAFALSALQRRGCLVCLRAGGALSFALRLRPLHLSSPLPPPARLLDLLRLVVAAAQDEQLTYTQDEQLTYSSPTAQVGGLLPRARNPSLFEEPFPFRQEPLPFLREPFSFPFLGSTATMHCITAFNLLACTAWEVRPQGKGLLPRKRVLSRSEAPFLALKRRLSLL